VDFHVEFLDLLEAMQKISKRLRKMANNKEFMGIIEYLIDNAQAEV